jgi:catechol 2,3-dioxygenase-like lactoylglutathione lyase family enzyme
MELIQIRLIVSDFRAAFRFYRDVLGLKPQDPSDAGPYAKFSLPSGAAAIALHDRADLAQALPELTATNEGGERALIVLKVDDVDATLAQLRQRGAHVQKEAGDRWGRLRVAYLRDPEGNLIELQQWLAQRS